MGWGEFVSPAEAQAAADAKEMAEADALAEDRRTAMLCEAIRSGLYEIADAIRDAAAVPARQVLDTDNDDEVDEQREAEQVEAFHEVAAFERIVAESGIGRRRDAFRSGPRSGSCGAHVVYYLALDGGVIGSSGCCTRGSQHAATSRRSEGGC